MIHGVKGVQVYDGPYTDAGVVKSTRDILITLVDGGTIKIMCFVEKEADVD